MKVLIKNNGFTLIEIIVSINLGFLLLTVLVSFFLFSARFVSSSTKLLDERQNINTFIQNLESKLRKAEYFEIQKLDSNYITVINTKDTVLINRNSFSLLDLYKIENIDNYIFSISFQSGENILIQNNEIINSSYDNSNNNSISSQDILELELRFSKANQNYIASYFSPNISINRFRNVHN